MPKTRARLCLLAILFVLGCNRQDDAYRTALLGTFPESVDPVGLTEINIRTVLAQICTRLISADEALNISGDVASSWEIKDSGRVYEFRLRTDRKFADGDTISSKDVLFSFERALKAQHSIAGSSLAEVASFNAETPDRFRITLKRANPRFLYKLTHPRFCILNSAKPFVSVGKHEIPNSGGAYRISKAEKHQIRLEANPFFTEQALEKTIDVYFLSQEDAIKRFQNAELEDLSFYLLEDKEIDSIKMSKRVVDMRYYWTWVLSVNPQSQIFNSHGSRVRFTKAVDYDLLIQRWGSRLNTSRSVIPYGIRGFSDVHRPPGPKQKLKCSTPIRIAAIKGLPAEESLHSALKSSITEASGCDVLVESVPMSDFEKQAKLRTYDLYMYGVGNRMFDPLEYYRGYISGHSENYIGCSYPPLDQEYSRIGAIAPSERTPADYKSIEKKFYEAGCGSAVGHPVFKFVYAENVKQIYNNPIGMDLNQWWRQGRGAR